jgi:hypothetical protein
VKNIENEENGQEKKEHAGDFWQKLQKIKPMGKKTGEREQLHSPIKKMPQEFYRFENWNLALAPLWPYFFLSLILGSRRTKPARLSGALNSASRPINALVMPCRMALA